MTNFKILSSYGLVEEKKNEKMSLDDRISPVGNHDGYVAGMR